MVALAVAAKKIMLALDVAIVTAVYITVRGVTLISFLIVVLVFLYVVA